jgi:lipopolysaccharide export system protein LptC
MASAGIELNLPDLPEVPIRLGADGPPLSQPAARVQRLPWSTRLRETVMAYLPLLLMVLLALGTWWLVKNSPQPAPVREAKAVTGEPDYTMRGFTVQRFASSGGLQLTLEGRQLHHYPDSDRIEIEELRLTALGAAGRPAIATARRAVSDGKARDVQLLGGAQLRSRTADGLPLEIDSEFLRFETQAQRVSSDRAVRLRAGTTLATTGGLVWDHPSRALELKPPIRAVIQPRVPQPEVTR